MDLILGDGYWVNVNSSMINRIGYSQTLNTLFIQFKNKSIYEYNNVSYQTFQNLIKADSVGQYFITNIKKNIKGVQIL